MSVSVVVPTRNRPEALRRCLASLRGQGVDLEVIVVDDGGAARKAVAWVAAESGARVLRLDGRGPAAARNAGIGLATGEHVLLLDDDCVAASGWAAALVAAVGGEDRLVVGGTVSPPAAASTWVEASELLATRAERAAGFFRTINLCARRELLLALPFDERFTVAAGEDRDWCARAARSGVSFRRVASAAVEHDAALGARAFFSQQLRYGRAVRVLRALGTHRPMPLGAVRSGVRAGFGESPAVGAAILAAHAGAAVGYVAEWMSPQAR